MPLIKIEHLNNATIGIWEALESDDFFRDIPAGYLTGFQPEKFNARRKKEFLASRYLLKKILKDDCIALEFDEQGKLKDADKKYHFSISHSGDRVAAIASKDFKVGIDIEKVHSRVKKVMHKFLNETERNALGENPELWRITLCWSAKESIFKMIEKPGLSFSNEIKLDVPVGEKGSFPASVLVNSQWQQVQIHFEKTGDYVLTFCVGSK